MGQQRRTMGAKTPRKRNKADGEASPKSQPPAPNFVSATFLWITATVNAMWLWLAQSLRFKAVNQPAAQFSFGDGELPTKKKAKRKKKKVESFVMDESPAATTAEPEPVETPVETPVEPAAPVVEIAKSTPKPKPKPSPNKPKEQPKAKAKPKAPPAPISQPEPSSDDPVQFQSPTLQPEIGQLILQIPESPSLKEPLLAGSASWYDQVEEEEEEALAAAAAAAAAPKPVPKTWAKVAPVVAVPIGRIEKSDNSDMNWQQRELMKKSTSNDQVNKQSNDRAGSKQKSDWQTSSRSNAQSNAQQPVSNLPFDATRCLWVGGVSLKANEDDLKGMFSEMGGEVIKVKLLKEKKCAFITMDSKESAAEALHQLHDKTLIDRRLTINFAKEQVESKGKFEKKQRDYADPRQPRTAQPAEAVSTPHLLVEASGLTKDNLLALLPSGSVIGLVPTSQASGKGGKGKGKGAKPSGSWFADFTSVRAAAQAKQILESNVVNGVAISASYTKGRPSKQLWVGNLSPSVSEAALTAAFAVHGTVQGVELLGNSHCAFVWMATAAAASKAADAMHGTFLGSGPTEYKGQSGLPVKVNFADKGGSKGPPSHTKQKPKVDDANVAAAAAEAPAATEPAHTKPAAAKAEGKKIKVERKTSVAVTKESTTADAKDSKAAEAPSKGGNKSDGKVIKVQRRKNPVTPTDAAAPAVDKAKPERKKIKVERRQESATKGNKQSDDKPKPVAPSADIPLPNPKPVSSNPK